MPSNFNLHTPETKDLSNIDLSSPKYQAAMAGFAGVVKGVEDASHNHVVAPAGGVKKAGPAQGQGQGANGASGKPVTPGSRTAGPNQPALID